MDLKSLKICLDFVEQQIAISSISSIIENLKYSSYLNNFLLVKSEIDISSIIEQAKNSHSPLRVSSLLCLEIASSKDPVLNERYYSSLVQSLLEAALYDSVLEIADHYKSTNYNFLRSLIFACYKTNRWHILLKHFNSLAINLVEIDIKLIVIRALLELDEPYKAYKYLQEIQDCPLGYLNQYFILTLLVKQRLGQLTFEDVNNFFALIASASPSEKSALAVIWPTIEIFITNEEYLSSSLATIINHFWYSLSTNTLLVDGFSPLPSLDCREKIKRIVFMVENFNYITTLRNIVRYLWTDNHSLSNIDIVVFGNKSPLDKTSPDVIDLSHKSTTANVRYLRDLNIDVLVDTIGITNNRWIEVLAQKVATYQIGWFSTDLTSFFAPFYDYLIVDRWTKPTSLNYFSIKTLEFSGITTLSESMPVKNPISENSFLPIDTFLLLGKPEQLPPGSQQFIKSLLSRYPNVTFKFIDKIWQGPGLLDFWWSSVFTKESAPNQLLVLNQNSISDRFYSSLILSFSCSSPTPYLSSLLSKGVPIVCLSSRTFQARSMIGFLESLGLGSFVTDDPDTFNEIIDIILSDSTLRLEISRKLPHQFKKSLTLDHQLFATNLTQSLSLLSG